MHPRASHPALTRRGHGRPINMSGTTAVASAPDVRRFEVFEVNLRSRELKKEGRRVKLQAQPFQVLAMLIESPGEAVSRKDLCQKLWPADTFVDFDHGLNSAVARLRETLHDSASAPRLIETVPRFGYRFIGDLQESAELCQGTCFSTLNGIRALWLALIVILAAVFSGTSWQGHPRLSLPPSNDATKVGLQRPGPNEVSFIR